MKILIISPVRDEDRFVSNAISCMINQTLLPQKWIIVNDGSKDRTEEKIKEYLGIYPFLDYIELPDRGYRKPGEGVINAFYAGLDSIDNNKYDIIAKFDVDLDFPPDTLQKISDAFEYDKKLGITGGCLYEKDKKGGKNKKLIIPKGYVNGPNKFYRRECFENIGGLICRAGWDGVDIIKARMTGWNTGTIESLKINHLRPMGMSVGEGLVNACNKYGDVSYFMGGYFWYFLLRVIGRSLESQNSRIGYYMLKGYFHSKLEKRDRESLEFRKFLKKYQINNIKTYLKRIIPSIKCDKKLNSSRQNYLKNIK
jgi:poly-beta-1,6-N-acetyl-D-glucosamine synthase